VKEGPAFLYAASLEELQKGDLKGKVAIRDILEVAHIDGNDKKFEIVVQKRTYKLAAKTAQECTKWVEALQKLRDYTIKEEARFHKELMNLHPGLVLKMNQEDDDQAGKKEFFLLQPFHMIDNAVKKVVVGTAVDLVKKGVENIGSLFASGKRTTNQQYLAAKKFDVVLDTIDPNLLKSRLNMGILLREVHDPKVRKEADTKEVVEWRWCFLISSKPILTKDVDPEDEATLAKGAIPLQIDYDTLYLYGEDCDDSEPIDKILMKDVTHLIINKVSHAKEEYHFTLDLGDKKFNLICSSFPEMVGWLRSIQNSRATSAELLRSKDPVFLKNLFWVLKIKDDNDGENKLAQKIENDYEKLTQTETVSIKSLILVQEKVANEFLSIINACLVCRVPRVDVIKMYTAVYHEGILSALKNYYKIKAQDLDNADLFEMIKFLNWYASNLSVYGTSFVDVRIKEALGALSTIAATNILKRPNLKAIKNILDQFLQDPVDVDSRGRITSPVPKDVLKILNETLKIASYCNIESFVLKLLDTCQNTLEYCQDGLDRYVDDADLSNEKLVAICNDVMRFISEIKEFLSLAQDILPTNHAAIFSHFDESFINKSFVIIGKKSYKKLAVNLLSWTDMTSPKPKSRGFIDLDLQSVIGCALQQTEEILDKLHPTYFAKLSSEILKQSVENYVNTFFEFFEKKLHKKEDLLELETKLKAALEIFSENFENLKGLKASDVKKTISPINDLYDFITSQETDLLFLSVAILKKNHPNSVKWTAIEQIVKLKTEKASKQDRDNALTSCKDTFQKAEQETIQHPLNDDDIASERSSIIRQDSIDLGEEVKAPTLQKSRSRGLGSVVIRPSIDGMLKMKTAFLKNIKTLIVGDPTEYKYFSVRNDKMHCFKEKKAEIPIITWNFKEAIGCYPYKENSFVLTMLDSDVIKNSPHLKNQKNLKEAILRVVAHVRDHEGVTEYKFYAENQLKQEMWVKTINNVINMVQQDDEEETIQLSDPSVQIYRDTSALFVSKEALPSLKFEFTKIIKPKPKPKLTQNIVKEEPVQAVPPVKKLKGAKKQRKSLVLVDDALVPLVKESNDIQEPLEDTKELEDDDVPPVPKIGLCAAFCMKLGFIKSKPRSKVNPHHSLQSYNANIN